MTAQTLHSGVSLAEIKQRLEGLQDPDRDAVKLMARERTAQLAWVPNPGPQTAAYFSPADELFYGGQAGGGKSDLEIGLAMTAHHRSLLLRRTNRETDGIVERMAEILGNRDGWNGQANVWRLPHAMIDVGGCQLEEDRQKYKGKPHDLICFDEVSDFTESQYTFIIAWNRSTDAQQRCRVVAAGNPPTRPEGLWVLRRWAAWLDPNHPNPAQPGELRWYTSGADGSEIEVDGPGPHIVDREPVMARSRSYIPARLSDNPDLAATNYDSVLAALPPGLREAYRDGRFDFALRDDLRQCVPSAWIHAARERWTPTAPHGVPMCAIGVDVAQGGGDETVLAMRYDGWYAPLITYPGALTPDGRTVAGLIMQHRRDGALPIIDMGGGYGGAAYEHLTDNGVECFAYKGAEASTRRTLERQLRFFNKRSEAYWRFREALDPSQPGGSPIMLPEDTQLVSDLAAPLFEIGPNGIKVEPKDKVISRIGRSPDRGDAVVMAWFSGAKAVTDAVNWTKVGRSRVFTPKVVVHKPR